MTQLRWLSFAGLIVLTVAACGGKDSKKSASTGATQAACSGTPLSGAPRLPSKFPTFDSVTYTKQSTLGPTEVVEGYYDGGVQAAHDEIKAAFERVGYAVLFDEVEEHDSEVAWKGQGRSGQVGLRDECGSADRTYVRISNRPQ